MVWRENNGSQAVDFHLELYIGKAAKAVYVASIDADPTTLTPFFVVGATLSRSDHDTDSRAEAKPE